MGSRNRDVRRTGQGNEERRLLKKGKRGILNVIFGRTMLVVLTLALQIGLLVVIFSSLQSMQSMLPFYYALLLLLYGVIDDGTCCLLGFGAPLLQLLELFGMITIL